MKIRSLASVLSAAIVLLGSAALAHPGHGLTDGNSWLHWLTEPVHVAPQAALAALAVWGLRRSRSARRTR